MEVVLALAGLRLAKGDDCIDIVASTAGLGCVHRVRGALRRE